MIPQHSKSFNDDQKKYRKIRKYLRQIEHLQLLTRDLNDEEMLKVKRKQLYREQLNHLTAKYVNYESFFEQNETSALNESSSSVKHQAEHEVSVTSQVVQEEAEKAEEERKRIEVEVDNLAAELTEKLSVEAKVELSVPNEVTKLEGVEVKINQTNKKNKKGVEKKLPVLEPAEAVTIPKVEKAKSNKVEATKPFNVFKTNQVEEAHEDLITSVDVCTETNMVVTGSRDTTLKVWCIKDLNLIKFLHSFGGHSSPITCVRFWKGEYFRSCLQKISKQDDTEALCQSIISPDDAQEMLEEILKQEGCFPVVISSSLDQTIRIWDIVDGKCLKELYLYNRINNFQVDETAFVVGLDGGKIQYWNNLSQVVSEKCFEDTESVCCVRILNEGGVRSVFGLSNSGTVKVYSLSGESKFEICKETDVFSLLSVTHSLRKNFKSFELINKDQILLINDNQSFVIFHDIIKEQCMLISTNTNNYGFTSCFTKLDNKFLISSYSIDDASSSINVFQYEDEIISNPKSEIAYQYTLEGDRCAEGSCISTLSCSNGANENMTITSGSSTTLTIWLVESTTKIISNQKRAASLKMCKQASFNTENNEDDSDSEQENENEHSKLDECEESKKGSGSNCLIQ